MPRYSTAFGMDVHLRSTTVCALDAETGEAVTRRFRGNPWGEVAEWMSGFPGPSLAAYESGYLGFAPQRELSGLGVDCVVAAVSRVPRSAADLSSKNDRNDAARMAKAILSHDISPVWVPSPEIEGLRDLAGAHDAATARLAAAKQRLLAFLARRGYAYGGTTPAGNPRRYWTYDFLRWLDKVRPADDGGIRALAALRNEVEAAAETRDWIGYTDVDSSGRGARDGRAVYEGPQAPEAFHRRVQEADSRPLQRRKAQARDHGRVRPRQEHRGEVDQVDKRDRLAARRGQPHARAEPDLGARAREPQAPDGGRRLKTSGADIRSKVRAIAANEGRYPISAQCRLLGVARSTYYSMRSRRGRPAAPDPAAPAVVAAHAASKGRYGSRKIKASLERSGVTVSRRRVCRIMRENGLVSAYGRKRFKVHPGAVNEADVPNVVARGFGGRAPRTHICSDLTYVRVGASWNYVCLLVDLYNREIVGHSAGPRKDARLVKSAFATLSFPISDIEVFHTDRGSEFDNAEIDLMLEAFGIERSLSAKGCPYDNAVDESTNRILKAELVHRETFGTTRELRAKLSDYVHWYNNFRIHSTLGYMSPVEFREAGLSLPGSSK